MNRSAAFTSLVFCLFLVFWLLWSPAGRTAAALAENPWATLLKGDVEAMHRMLLENHPGAVDGFNRGFSRWLEVGYRQALDRARSCNSYEGYRFALEAYAVGFRDGHLGAWVQLRREGVRWPGFMVGWQPEGAAGGGQFVVRVVGDGKSGEGVPAIGSRVISCDGQAPRQVLEREVFPFSGNPELEIGWIEAAPMLLVDEANPWRGQPARTCRVRENGVERDYLLQWQQIDHESLRAHRAAAQGRPKVDFVIRAFGERGVWVGLPSFGASREKTVAALKAAIAQAPSWRDRDPIVFDVRTNVGGTSAWGKQMLEALYGKDFLASRLEPLFEKEYVEWRVSPANVAHMNTLLASTLRVNGPGSEEETRMRAAVADVARALVEGKSLCREADAEEEPPADGGAPNNPVAGRVFLLTDGECTSACLDFADMVRALPGAQQVGRTTAADSVYMERRDVTLPSGIGRLAFATKVYRNRPRGNNQPYVPHHIWEGDIADTAALERWILSLPRAAP
jgi:hypothetical protein